MKYLLLSIVVMLSSCSVFKKLNKEKTETQTESKIDSTANVKNDITKESKTETVITETIDTVIFVTPKGHLIEDTATHKGKVIPVQVKKKKVTEVKSDVKEVDKSKSNVDVKKQEEKKVETKVVAKEVKKVGLPIWAWIIIVLALAGWLYWKFR